MVSSSKLFKQEFTKENIELVYAEKISLSSVVGRDGVRRVNFEENLDENISNILRKVLASSYTFTGYKEKLISKGFDRNPRQISIPTFRDRLTLKIVCNILSKVFRDAILPPPHDYIKDIFALSKIYAQGYSYLRLDIKEYFPSINHERLLKNIRRKVRVPQLNSLISKAIKTSTGKPNDLKNANLKGVPQGLSISNILSSIYLHHFDLKHKKNTNYHYFRYVDDVLIICPSTMSKVIYNEMVRDLRTLKLTCHPLSTDGSGKTAISSLTSGIDYLGYQVSNRSLSVRPSSYRKMFSNLLKIFTQYKYKPKKELFIFKLNLKISGCLYEGERMGWMFFFSQTENTSQLRYLDEFVGKLLRRFNLDTERENVKTFIKSFHEIRFKLRTTKYIPDFSNYDRDQKVQVISLYSRKPTLVIDTWSIETIESTFKKYMFKEMSELEKDMMESFS